MSKTGLSKTYAGGFSKNSESRPQSLTATAENKPQIKKFKFKRVVQERKYDPANPFTYWLKGTDACNEDYDREQEKKRHKVMSANSDGRRVPYYNRLSKPAGVYTREGFFRKLKNELGSFLVDLEDIRFDNSKEEIVRNNLIRFEEQIEEKAREIDFNELIFKAKRIPIKKYIEYKREIRLSKLKQVDIEANINDMRNLIVKADEELEENIGTEKKSFDEVNQALVHSRNELKRKKDERANINVKLNDKLRTLNSTRNEISHLENETRDLRSKIQLMEKNREFLIRISGFEDDRANFDKFDSSVRFNTRGSDSSWKF